MSKQRTVSNRTRAGVLFTAAILGGLAVAGTGVSANAVEPPTTTQHASESAPPQAWCGDTILQVKNTTRTTLTVWRYEEGKTSKNCYFVGTIEPWQTWSGQGNEPFGSSGLDVNVLIKTEDGKPKCRITGKNGTVTAPTVTVSRSSIEPRWKSNCLTRVNRDIADRDSKTIQEETKGDFTFGVQRLADVDSGHWYQADHAKLQVYINSVPHDDYDVAND